MHTNFDHAENFETLLASEFGRIPQIDKGPGREGFDAGFKVVNALASDLALNMAVLDLDEFA